MIHVTNQETGETEMVPSADDVIVRPIDMETGEVNGNRGDTQPKKRPFHIPKHYLQPENCKITVSIKRKEEVILGYNKQSHRLFLMLPALFFNLQVVLLFFILVECALHIWAHRKNLTNKNEEVCYRSPLYLLTRNFCAKCRSEMEMTEIGKLHDDSRLRFNLHQVTKTI